MSGSLSKVLSFLSFLSLFSTWIICVFGGQGLTLDLIKKNLVQFLKSQSNTCTPSLNSITTNKKMQSIGFDRFWVCFNELRSRRQNFTMCYSTLLDFRIETHYFCTQLTNFGTCLRNPSTGFSSSNIWSLVFSFGVIKYTSLTYNFVAHVLA